MNHTFHIPVLGLAFSVDSPIKIAQYGISSAVSIVDDELTERLREYHSKVYQLPFQKIPQKEFDARAKRLSAYLDMMQEIIDQQIQALKESDFETSESLNKYFQLLPSDNVNFKLYKQLSQTADPKIKQELAQQLKKKITAGHIEVNIMSKVDKANKDEDGNLLESIYSDATSALRGFVNSRIQSTVVLSAGMNPRLYNFLAEMPAFLPDSTGQFNKKVCLKVSDYRSANIQAKYLAKKGIWISEFRIESGLNCGGHAFATEGFLLGPILEEFKQNREQLREELFGIYKQTLLKKDITIEEAPNQKLTAQGGIGTGDEHQFLLEYYNLDSIGWGSPFLLVPEATTVDDQTLQALASADTSDFYLSGASPLGVPFNNFRKSTAEIQRIQRIEKNRAGAPCTKKYLISNDDFSNEPICTASRVYQYSKLKELELLQELNFLDQNKDDIEKLKNEITEKTCLCEGLASSAYLKYNINKNKENTAVAICPGPNTAYFKDIYTLSDMVNHIYGRTNLLENVSRSHCFINELRLYIDYLNKFIENNTSLDNKKEQYIDSFREQLLKGIQYYESIAENIFPNDSQQKTIFLEELSNEKENILQALVY